MADRYTYLPTIGVAIALVWGVAGLVRRRAALATATAVALAACTLATRAAIPWWHDDLTLFGRAVALRPNAVAHANFGVALVRRGEVAAGIAQYRAALALWPRDAKIWFNLGVASARIQAWAGAVEAFGRSVEIKPTAEAWNELGVALTKTNRHADAERAFRSAIRLDLRYDGAYSNLALLYLWRGDRAAARGVVEELRRVDPARARDVARYVGLR
jgi:Flp pilus assembly protein TadD